MPTAYLEHVNFTVEDPAATAKHLETWFGWKVRWKGPSKDNGTTYHVGNATSYIALYTKGDPAGQTQDSYDTRGAMNHLAIVVDDLDQTEEKILADGFKTHNHGDYEPGRRFYFHDDNGVEFEIVSYAD
ncbi:hypothetical protein GCM10011316_16070 [Roseibium aquae]|uniref:VOC domain-containing protein n=1 Tax=Roseibium aquae TaxID=1323746 RepID=A0A916THA0_9HYPH|nr:VOC family protein [Roseibium aquae]GGB44870.1 hypothetical protein GCM10011316_16070 [Roseibium aquae]